MADRGDRIVVRLRMEAHIEPDVESANVVGEIRGRERPDEIVVVSGHLDSWDVGAGATDDGGGCVVSWEALRIMKKLNLRPRRTVRVVLWTNEENGGRGGAAYRDQHRAELARHVLMMESDNGVFRPLGFGFAGSDAARQTIAAIATLLSGLAASDIVAGGDGADITPSARAGRIPGLSLEVDASQYFQIHHTQADTVDKIDPVDMAKCAAAITVMAYVVADLPLAAGGVTLVARGSWLVARGWCVNAAVGLRATAAGRSATDPPVEQRQRRLKCGRLDQRQPGGDRQASLHFCVRTERDAHMIDEGTRRSAARALGNI